MCTMDVVFCFTLASSLNVRFKRLHTEDRWLASHHITSVPQSSHNSFTGVDVLYRWEVSVVVSTLSAHRMKAQGKGVSTYPRVKTLSNEVLPQAPSPLLVQY